MGYGPWDVAKDLVRGNLEYVASHIKDERLRICGSCDQYEKFIGNVGGRCRQCGCFMQTKTALTRAECPLNKWPK